MTPIYSNSWVCGRYVYIHGAIKYYKPTTYDGGMGMGMMIQGDVFCNNGGFCQ